MSTWEQRMSEWAAARSVEQHERDLAEERAAIEVWQQQLAAKNGATEEEWIGRIVAEYHAEGIPERDEVSYPCACMGAPLPWFNRCRCALRIEAWERARRGLGNS